MKDEKAVIKELPEKWATKRPEQLTPEEFVDLTLAIYGEKPAELTSERDYDAEMSIGNTMGSGVEGDGEGKRRYQSPLIWRDTRL